MLALIIAFGSLSGIAFATDVGDFQDVPTNAWYYSIVSYAVERGMVSGTSDTTFSPNNRITRAQFISILYRAIGNNEVSSSASVFTDVPEESYYFTAVSWAKDHGITAGTSATTFGSAKPITRQEAVVMMGRAIESLCLDVADAENPVPGFRDASQIANWAQHAVDIMRRKGLVSGYDDGTFGPQRRMTRAEGTTLIVQLDKKLNNIDPDNGNLSRSADKIHFISLNGYSSDSILVESNGKYMLVDAGNPDASVGGNYAVYDNNANGNAVVKYLQSIGVTHLDYLVMTHNHSDHIGGVPTLCNDGLIDSATTVYYRTNKPTKEETTTDWQNLEYLNKALTSLRRVNANIICLMSANITSLSFRMGDYTIDFRNLDEDYNGVVDFYGDDENRNCIVLKVTKGSISTMLASDLGGIEERKLIANGAVSNISILKASHHGSRTSNTYEWLTATKPSAVVLTRNQWIESNNGVPAYAYLKDKGIPVYICSHYSKKAVVFTIENDHYEVSEVNPSFREVAAVKYSQAINDGFYYWYWEYAPTNNTVKIENGRLVKNAYRSDSYGYTYYFNSDGIGTPV